MSNAQPAEDKPIEAKSPFELRVSLGIGIPQNAVKTALTTGEMGFLHSFTTGSTVDGPGVRLVAWTAGCEWRCLYCHNPDTWSMINGLPVTLDHAIEEVAKYRHGLKIMSGGITISGGEPLLQDRFAVRLLTAAKAMGVHTAVETNGHLGDRLADEEIEQIDLVLLGLKTTPARHRHLTGKEMGPTLEFAQRLARLGRKIWVRFVLVPGLTDDPKNIEQIAKFAAKLGNVERVEVLPFHQMGRYKWKELGLNYTLENTGPPSSELVARACGQFRAEGLDAY
ncbi:MAG TPA: pyruvate formate-lyase-activating protein [Pyrinomonadaceae bacterium]|nr:pyruvate formate-lyase-activating protein [Pyrinomonadaceae bacterium]